MSNISGKQILIAGVTPYFCEREVLWFEENAAKIIRESLKNKWWREQTLFLEPGQKAKISEISRKISDMGYEKVKAVSIPGEFSGLGGMIEIFPANSLSSARIDFLGNAIETIEISSAKISAETRLKILKNKTKRAGAAKAEIFRPGDFVVHLDHGVGIFKEETTASAGKNTTEEKYLVLEYAPSRKNGPKDKLYVPERQIQKLSRYVGFVRPKISRLGTELWLKTKHKIKEEVEKFARELLELYAKREISKREPYHDAHFSADGGQKKLLAQFENSFEHIDTPDQQKAWEDVKKDLESEQPLDRIICGDVGFGKTEIALRAAFAAIASGYQAAVLCPTTILADQHFETFSERLKNFPVNLALLSRFEPRQKQKETLEKLKKGGVDIVIGTHRLLSKDIEFKNLRLLIIDEEQKFGVAQKEKLKKFKENLDILSLSATPIPRTLYMALSGLRQISRIDTAPPGRKSIRTFVEPYSEAAIAEAIKKEMKRGGQIYFLHNRVQNIEATAEHLRKLTPGAKIKWAHARMGEKDLRKIIHDFRARKFDLLLATTIIENGLDLPNVNSLIVADSTKLGLSQSHQIRGRIGRSDREAFAYFLYREKDLFGPAKERLEALEKFQELGEGYKIAERDLEIRGAGNILGKKQSGALNQIGLNLYCQMLSDAVNKLRQ